MPNVLSKTTKSERTIASILDAGIEKSDIDIKDKTNECYSTKIKQVTKRHKENNYM